MDNLDEKIVLIFTQAQTRLESVFFEAIRTGNYSKAKVMLSKLKTISDELKTKYSSWLYAKAYSAYMEWYNDASNELWKEELAGLKSVDMSSANKAIIELQNIWSWMSVNHVEAIKALIDSSSWQVFASIDWISKNLNMTMARLIQWQIRQNIAVWIAMWLSTEDQKQAVLKTFGKNRSIWMFRDSLGRKWDARTYAENIVRTETSRAYNLWTVNRWLELWHTKYQVIELPWCCDLCATHNWKIYDISKQWSIELPPYHNQCRGIIKIYFWNNIS